MPEVLKPSVNTNLGVLLLNKAQLRQYLEGIQTVLLAHSTPDHKISFFLGAEQGKIELQFHSLEKRWYYINGDIRQKGIYTQNLENLSELILRDLAGYNNSIAFLIHYSNTTTLNSAAIDAIRNLSNSFLSDTTTKEVDGINTLYLAAAIGEFDILKKLITEGANINALNLHNHHTPLMIASERGHTEIVQALINAGAATHSSVMIACQKGHTEIVKVLMNAGVPVSHASLQSAISNGHLSTVQAIINHNPNLVNKSNTTLLEAALISSRQADYEDRERNQIVKLLLDKGVRPRSPIGEAAEMSIAALVVFGFFGGLLFFTLFLGTSLLVASIVAGTLVLTGIVIASMRDYQVANEKCLAIDKIVKQLETSDSSSAALDERPAIVAEHALLNPSKPEAAGKLALSSPPIASQEQSQPSKKGNSTKPS